MYAISPKCIHIKFVAQLCINEAVTSTTCWVSGIVRLSTSWHILSTQCHTHFTRYTLITEAIRWQRQICSNKFTVQRMLKSWYYGNYVVLSLLIDMTSLFITSKILFPSSRQSDCQITLLILKRHVQFSIGGNCSLRFTKWYPMENETEKWIAPVHIQSHLLFEITQMFMHPTVEAWKVFKECA